MFFALFRTRVSTIVVLDQKHGGLENNLSTSLDFHSDVGSATLFCFGFALIEIRMIM